MEYEQIPNFRDTLTDRTPGPLACNKINGDFLKNQLSGFRIFAETMYMASKYSEKWPFWHFSSPDSIGIWTRKVACKLAILQQNHVKWLKYTQKHRLARKIVSPNSRQSRSTNIYIWSPLRVLWACVDQFWVWHESEKSVFQKTAIYFITRQRHSLVVGLSMCKISKSLMLHVHILFGVIPSTNRPKQCACRTL